MGQLRFNGGTSHTGFYDKYNNTGNKIIVSARGANAGFVNRTYSPYWAGNSCYSIGIKNTDKLNWSFVYYFIKHSEKSLAIQAKIVRILDTFTELTTELNARQKQYEHYRDLLLSFPKPDVEDAA